jgi:hypothetical protein
MKKNTTLLAVLIVSLLTINVKAKAATAPTLSKNHISVSIGYGSRNYNVEDPDWKTFEIKNNSPVRLELSYLRSITDKFRVGVSFLSGTSYKYNFISIDEDVKTLFTYAATKNLTLETKDNGSFNLLLEYDFYSVNQFTFFASTNLGISMYNTSVGGTYNVARVENATGDIEPNFDEGSFSPRKKSTTGLNYGLGLGANYAINDKLTLTNKLGYNLKSDIDALTWEDGAVTKGQFSGEASYLVGLRYSF